jgi:hypothetical protein
MGAESAKKLRAVIAELGMSEAGLRLLMKQTFIDAFRFGSAGPNPELASGSLSLRNQGSTIEPLA